MIVRQFFIYIMVGIITTLADVGLMQLLIYFDMHYLGAATFGFVIALLLIFFLYSLITFKKVYSHGRLSGICLWFWSIML